MVKGFAMKARWLNREVAHPGPFLTLCLSEAEYKAALKHCGVAANDAWIKTEWSDATAHYLDNTRGQRVAIVCIRVASSRTAIEVAGLLVHEAVHCWQDYCERIGEHRPGAEQEAYAIQSISQELMAEYARRIAS